MRYSYPCCAVRRRGERWSVNLNPLPHPQPGTQAERPWLWYSARSGLLLPASGCAWLAGETHTQNSHAHTHTHTQQASLSLYAHLSNETALTSSSHLCCVYNSLHNRRNTISATLSLSHARHTPHSYLTHNLHTFLSLAHITVQQSQHGHLH